MVSFLLGRFKKTLLVVETLVKEIYTFAKYLYKNYLSRYPFFRFLRNLPRNLVDHLYYARFQLFHLAGRGRFPLVSRSAYILKAGADKVVFQEPSVLGISGPRFVGNSNFTPIAVPWVELEQPPLDIALFCGAMVMGGTNYTIIDGMVVQPDVYDVRRDVCPAELMGVAKTYTSKRQISLYTGKDQVMVEAISLLGCCTGNYAHWLTETLPKLLYVDGLEVYNSYPLLVDEWIHPNFIDSIELIGRQKRRLIHVPRWATVKVEKLIDISPPAYVPPEHRIFHETGQLADPVAGDFPISRSALKSLKDRALEVLQLTMPEKGLKLFLRRERQSTGNFRCIRNTEEVEKLVGTYGFTFVDPATLSFREQVSLFSRATCVVAPVGAALSNLIFSPPGCQIIGLSPYYEKANYYYFSNLMGVLEHDLYYVLGEQVSHGVGHPLHKDYLVDIQSLKIALDRFGNDGGVN
ncbi:hypothetical protein CLJ08_05445 [Pseudomonas mosselii]|nr:hypothetical protein CLJ08_05445 [Pseudomonas mosselii]